jgi:hypothetical protein
MSWKGRLLRLECFHDQEHRALRKPRTDQRRRKGMRPQQKRPPIDTPLPSPIATGGPAPREMSATAETRAAWLRRRRTFAQSSRQSRRGSPHRLEARSSRRRVSSPTNRPLSSSSAYVLIVIPRPPQVHGPTEQCPIFGTRSSPRIRIRTYTQHMDWQQWAALAVVGVAVAIALFARRRRRKAPGCGSGCCPTKPRLEVPSAKYRSPAGPRPQPPGA